MLPVVILAGGHGTRVRHLTGVERSKMLLPVDGRPFIDFKLASLAAAGATDVQLLVGHGASALREHVGTGADFRLRVTYLDEGDDLLGTGGAIARSLPQLPDTFWVTYGDTLLDVPLARVEAQLDRQDVLGIMTTLENRDLWEASNVDVESELVTAYEKGAQPGKHRWIDYGMLLLRRSAFAGFAAGSAFDLGDVLRTLVVGRRLGAFAVSERFHDVGTEDSWRETDAWARETGLWDRLELSLAARRAERPAVFLDRDGVLNDVRLVDGVPRPPVSVSDVHVADGAVEALGRLRGAGYALVVVTNQPDVPRGQTTRQMVEEINAAVQAALPVDAVYTCFHDSGDGCDCRKPRPGLLLQAARELDLSLERSWLVGDRWSDIAAAEAAGVSGVLLERDYSWRPSSDGPPPGDLRPVVTAEDIRKAAEAIVERGGSRIPRTGQSV